MSFFQYLNDTRSELRHVAWPTRMQTVIYTIIVIALSLLVAVYLGFFDFIFTTGLARVVQLLPGASAPASAATTTFDVSNIILATSSAPTQQ
jgi:preprotein translocase SecE subunit